MSTKRRIGMLLISVGLLPFVATALVAAGLLLPRAFGWFFEGFLGLMVPAELDAPDNWAVGITRMVRLLAATSAVGACLAATGAIVWQRRANS